MARRRTLSAESAETLRILNRQRRGKSQTGVRAKFYEDHFGAVLFICKANADIDPLTGVTPGSGDATEWQWNDDDELEATDNEFTIYNLSHAAITAGEFLVGMLVGNRRVIIFEACGEGSAA